MASKNEKKFVENLQNFGKALKSLVDTLKEREKNKETDLLDNLVKNLDANKINKIVEDLEAVKKDTANINKKLDEVLKIQKAAKEAKETGVFGEVSEVKNKNKIVDGIKVITLIAGGVLAIGMAFKLVGPVDFLSVIGLGAAMVAMAYAYSLVADIKNLDIKNAFAISAIMVIMSVGIASASYPLSMIKSLSLGQLITSVFIAGVMGIAIWSITKGLEGKDGKPIDLWKGWKNYLILPFVAGLVALSLSGASYPLSMIKSLSLGQLITSVFIAGVMGIAIWSITKGLKDIDLWKGWKNYLILPIVSVSIATGLAAASYPLSMIKPISFSQGLTAIIIAGTMGVAIYLVAKALEKTKLNMENILLLPILIPIVAAALVVSSYILQGLIPLKNPLGVVITSIVIGVSLAVFGAALWVLSRFKLKDIEELSEMSIGISMILVTTSWILSLVIPINLSLILTTLSIGLTMVIFGSTLWIVSKFGEETLTEGFIGVMIISTALALSSWIISIGSYGNFPHVDWAFGVGLSLLVFGVDILALGALMLFSGGLGFVMLGLGSLAMGMVAASIVGVSYILGSGNYGKYPTAEWALGVGLSLAAFGAGMMALGIIMAIPFVGKFILGSGQDAVLSIASTIVVAAAILGSGNYGKYPTAEWALGVGLSLAAFGAGMMDLGIIMAIPFVGKFILGSGQDAVLSIASTIVVAAAILGSGNYGKYPTAEWAAGVGNTLSTFSQFFALQMLSFGSLSDFIADTASAIVYASLILSKGNWTDTGFISWSRNIINVMNSIVDFLNKNQNAGDLVGNFVDMINKFSDISLFSIAKIDLLANSINNLSQSLSSLDISKVDALNKIGTTFLIISVIDQDKLEKTLKLIESKTQAVSKVLENNNTTAGMLGKNNASAGAEINGSPVGMTQVDVSGMDQVLTHLGNIDMNIANMVQNGLVKKTEFQEPDPKMSPNVNTNNKNG